MLKVIIADDERIIREGLRNAIVWEKYGFEICGLAENGLTALTLLEKQNPDLAIADIKMPGMDGLELIKKAKDKGLNTIFVILSGYSEFDYAKRAMRLGVKYYLTKPCGEKDLIDILKSAQMDIQNKQREKALLKNAMKNYKAILPDAEEQMIQQAIEKTVQPDDIANIWSMLGLHGQNMRMAVFRYSEACLPKNREETCRLAIQSTKSNYFSRCLFYHSDLILIVATIEKNEFDTVCNEIMTRLNNQPSDAPPIGFSQSWNGNFRSLHAMYLQAVLCLEYTIELTELPNTKNPIFHLVPYPAHIDDIKAALQEDNFCSIRTSLEHAAAPLGQHPDLHKLKAFSIALCLNLFFELIPEQIGDFNEKLLSFQSIGEVDKVENLVMILMMEAAAACQNSEEKPYSPTTQKIINYIQANIESPSLSLAYLSKEVLFMNEDYIGKLFAKETDKKFSQYLTNVRICKAIHLLRDNEDHKIYEICGQCGFGTNTQYFSQVFKKQTGFTPSQFQKL